MNIARADKAFLAREQKVMLIKTKWNLANLESLGISIFSISEKIKNSATMRLQ